MKLVSIICFIVVSLPYIMLYCFVLSDFCTMHMLLFFSVSFVARFRARGCYAENDAAYMQSYAELIAAYIGIQKA